MTYNINDAFLADQVYATTRADIGKIYTKPGCSQWQVVEAYSYADGYQGALFKNTATGKYEFVSRGTEPTSGSDVRADLQMGVRQLPDQMTSARNALQDAKGLISLAGGNPNDLTLVGHSLGGALTQMLAAENPQLQAQTFNPYGAGNLIPPGDYNNITNHVMNLDWVSVMWGSKMPGSTFAYAEVGLSDTPVYPGWVWPLLQPSFTLPSHGSDRFLDPFVSEQTGQSVSIDVFEVGGKLSDAIKTAIEAMQAAGKSLSESLTDIGKALQDWLPSEAFPGGDPFTGMPWPPGTAGELSLSEALAALGDALKRYLPTVDMFNGIDEIDYDINGNVNGFFTSARNWLPPRDPLVLDLNGGGITTSGINPAAPLYFDHAGDGLPNATGWVGAGEGLVVRDLNGNGLIDSGRELFGDNTVLTSGPNAGKNASDGFAALRDLDSNADGKFDALDAAFSSVKIWTDANGDAISQTAELHSFADLGLQSISLTASATNINLVDSNGAATGNTQTFAGSFTRVGGGVGAAATADLVGNLLLSSNNFYRQFSDDPVLTPTCGRARRASVPTGLRARGRGACGTRLNLHQQRGLRSNSAATANWLRPTGTATRHAGGGGWCGSRSDQVRKVQPWPLVAMQSAAASQACSHHQLRSLAAQALSDSDSVAQSQVFFAALDGTNVGSMQAGFERQAFLRPTQRFALGTNGQAKAYFWSGTFIHSRNCILLHSKNRHSINSSLYGRRQSQVNPTTEASSWIAASQAQTSRVANETQR